MSGVTKLESFDSGSNYNFGDKMIRPHTPRSLFDLSHLNTLTINNAGEVIPIASFETLPNDDFDINVSCLLRVLPASVPLYSRQRLYVYGFWSRLQDLTSMFDVFMRKGYTGDFVEYDIPSLVEANTYVPDGVTTIQPESYADFLGLPIGASVESIKEAHISALYPFMAMKVWRDYFMNKNYYINDRVILPNDDSRFRLDENGELLSAKDLGKTLKFDLFKSHIQDVRYIDDNTLVFGGFYHDFPSDRFISALPWTQRGSTATLSPQGSFSDSNVYANFNELDRFNGLIYKGTNNFSQLGNNYHRSIVTFGADSNVDPYGAFVYNAGLDSNNNYLFSANPTNDTINKARGFFDELGLRAIGLYANDPSIPHVQDNIEDVVIDGNRYATTIYRLNPSARVSLNITLNDIRELAIAQTELEKMARTDGSYSQFGLTFFGESSKASRDYRPYYIGGCYKNISFTEVLQTSATQSGNTPQGTYTGHGITGISNGRIGHVHCDDYGIIMLFACIMPDVYYSQGIDKKFTRQKQSDFYLPERAKLGLIPILNKELYYAGNNGYEKGEDNYVWAYNNPYDELRYEPNHIHGKIADPTNHSFFVYTQSRKFENLPNWGREFAEANNVRKDYLFSGIESAYTAQFEINCRAVRPIPYKPIPASII